MVSASPEAAPASAAACAPSWAPASCHASWLLQMRGACARPPWPCCRLHLLGLTLQRQVHLPGEAGEEGLHGVCLHPQRPAGLLGLVLHLPLGPVLLPHRQHLGWVLQALLLHRGQLLVSVLLHCRQQVVVVLQALLLLLGLAQGPLDPAGGVQPPARPGQGCNQWLAGSDDQQPPQRETHTPAE